VFKLRTSVAGAVPDDLKFDFPPNTPFYCRQFKLLRLNSRRNWSQLGLGHFAVVHHYNQFAFPLQLKRFVRIVSAHAPVFRHLRSNVDRTSLN
jgi:hypothetical protein